MVDLSAKPFNLDQDAVNWVHATIDSMTLEEKIGQLFINHNNEFTPEYLDEILDNYHVGGMRYRSGDAAEIQDHASVGAADMTDLAFHQLEAAGGALQVLGRAYPISSQVP